MNFCRTCKYWSVNAHAIGQGVCMNAIRTMMATPDAPSSILRTTQDFGCVCHETGDFGYKLFSPDESFKILQEFLTNDDRWKVNVSAVEKSLEAITKQNT